MQRFYTIWQSFLIISLACCYSGCTTPPEYNATADGLEWKLISFSDAESLDSAKQVHVEILITDIDEKDTLAYFFDQMLEPGDDQFGRFLKSRRVGDSLKVRTHFSDELNQDFPFSDTLVYQFRIDRMRTQKDLEDRKVQELMLLNDLVRTDSVKSEYVEYNGIYYRQLLEGDTLQVREGKEIVIHYQGRDLAGNVFDDSRRMYAPLRFVFGNEDQVLKGLEVGLEKMTKGEKAELILPSWFAFGSRGSADGRVNPYSTVIYRVEVLAVARE